MNLGALVVWHDHDIEQASRGIVMFVYYGQSVWKAEVVWHTSIGWQRGCYPLEMLQVLKPGFAIK